MPPTRSPFKRTAGRVADYAELRALGLTQAEVAERLGWHPRTVVRYAKRLRAAREAAAGTETPDLPEGPQAPVQRQGCGTYLAFRLHEVLGEEPCPECVAGETRRRVECVARLPARIPPPPSPESIAA